MLSVAGIVKPGCNHRDKSTQIFDIGSSQQTSIVGRTFDSMNYLTFATFSLQNIFLRSMQSTCLEI